MKRNLDGRNWEKQVLAEKLKSLTDKSKNNKLLFSQFDEASSFRPFDNKRQKNFRNDDPAKNLYEKYGHMWKRSARDTEDKIFGWNGGGQGNQQQHGEQQEEDEEDAFFLDPTKETHKKVLAQNQKLVKQDFKSFHSYRSSNRQQTQELQQQEQKSNQQHKRFDKPGTSDASTPSSSVSSSAATTVTNTFMPYDNKNFWGAGGEYQPHFEKREKVKYGRAVCTPKYAEMVALDPKNWRSNVNFIPIPNSKNKFLQVIAKKKRKMAQQKNQQSTNRK